MSKYDHLWQEIGKDERPQFILSFEEIERIGGNPIDHSFLTYKKELLAYGYCVTKISMKEKSVTFEKLEK